MSDTALTPLPFNGSAADGLRVCAEALMDNLVARLADLRDGSKALRGNAFVAVPTAPEVGLMLTIVVIPTTAEHFIAANAPQN